nr:MAG TPA: hypothetical protein [Caudoviricetes sp.]
MCTVYCRIGGAPGLACLRPSPVRAGQARQRSAQRKIVGIACV